MDRKITITAINEESSRESQQRINTPDGVAELYIEKVKGVNPVFNAIIASVYADAVIINDNTYTAVMERAGKEIARMALTEDEQALRNNAAQNLRGAKRRKTAKDIESEAKDSEIEVK